MSATRKLRHWPSQNRNRTRFPASGHWQHLDQQPHSGKFLRPRNCPHGSSSAAGTDRDCREVRHLRHRYRWWCKWSSWRNPPRHHSRSDASTTKPCVALCAKLASLLAMLVKLNVRKSVCVKRVSVRSTRSVNSLLRSHKERPASSRSWAFFLCLRFIKELLCDNLPHRVDPLYYKAWRRSPQAITLSELGAFHYHSAKFL